MDIVNRVILSLEGKNSSGPEIKKVEQDLDKLSAKATQASNVFSGLASKLAGLVTVGLFVNETRKAINTLEDLGKAAVRTGLSVQQMSEISFAATIGDVEDFSMAMRVLAQNVSLGSKAFQQLGISTQGKNGIQLLLEISDRFSRMDPSQAFTKSAIAMDLFGRSGLEMITFLSAGPEAIQALIDRAKELGYSFNEEAAQAANNFNDTLKELRLTTNVLFIQFAQQILPAITNFTTALQQSVASGGYAKQVFSELGDVIKGFVSALLVGLTTLAEFPKYVGRLAGSLSTMGKIFAPASDMSEYRERYEATGGDKIFKAAQNEMASAFDDMMRKYKATIDQVSSLWSTSSSPGKAELLGPPAPAQSQFTPFKVVTEQEVNAQKELLDRLYSEYQKTSADKMQLLEVERQKAIASVQERVKDESDKVQALFTIDATYAAKKLELEKQLALDELEVNRKLLEDRRNQIDQDWRLTATQKYDQKKAMGLDVSDEANPHSFVDQLQLKTNSFFSQFETMAQVTSALLVNTIGAAVRSISQELTNAILVTGNWGKAFLNVGRMILNQIVEMIIEYTLMHQIRMVLDRIFTSQSQQNILTTSAISTGAIRTNAAVQSEAAGEVAASGATAAATTSIWSWGSSATIGLALALAAIAAITAALAFEKGGIVPGAPSQKDNTLATVASGEYVVNTRAVQHYGAGLFEALNSMQVPKHNLDNIEIDYPTVRHGAFAEGGLVGEGGGINVPPAQVHVAFVNTQEQFNEFMRQGGEKHIVDAVSKNKMKLGIRS